MWGFTKVKAIHSHVQSSLTVKGVSKGPSLSAPELKQMSTTAHQLLCTGAGSSWLTANALQYDRCLTSQPNNPDNEHFWMNMVFQRAGTKLTSDV